MIGWSVGSNISEMMRRQRPSDHDCVPRSLWVIGMALALSVAVFLRVYGISKESLWIDEAFSAKIASGSFNQALGAERTNPPLYYVLLHFWIKLVGKSEAGLRSLSLVPSLIGISLTYILGMRLYGVRVGLIAAGFMAFSSFHISYAQEARAFALLSALLLASMVFMDIALNSKPDRRVIWPWMLYFVTTVAALYTHFYAVFFVVAENVFVVIRWRESRQKVKVWFSLQLGILIAFMPWLIIMLQNAAGGGQLRRYLLLKGPQAIFSFLAGDTFVPLDEAAVQDIKGTLVTHWYYLVAFVVGFGVLFIKAMSMVKEKGRSAVFCATMCLGPMVIAFVISFRVMIFDERYLIGVSPLLYIFLASGVPYMYKRGDLTDKLGVVVIKSLAVVLVTGIVGVSLYNYYFSARFGKEQWREAVAYIETNAQVSDYVMFDADFIEVGYDYYAKKPMMKVDFTDVVGGGASRDGNRTVSETAGYKRIWLVRSHFRDDSVLRRLQLIFVPKDMKVFPKDKGITVYLMVR